MKIENTVTGHDVLFSLVGHLASMTEEILQAPDQRMLDLLLAHNSLQLGHISS